MKARFASDRAEILHVVQHFHQKDTERPMRPQAILVFGSQGNCIYIAMEHAVLKHTRSAFM